MTNHWIDLRNSDCILVMGANPAENHPVSFRWVLKAKERGAKLLSVDPRYTRTSAMADIYARLRSGTDIPFLGGMLKYILDRDLIHKDYVVHYTNASFLVDDKFGFDEVEGVFSGYDPGKRTYDKSSWKYQTAPPATEKKSQPKLGPDGQPELDTDGKPVMIEVEVEVAGPPEPLKDPTLQHPRSVYQLLKKHFARYTLDRVSDITGTPEADLEAVYKTYAATGESTKAGTIMYAMGWTQHTAGTQNIRTMAIIQLLLGNIGRAGGGVNALRGESNVQGSTDHCLLFHILPGYLKTPKASLPTLADYNGKYTPKAMGALSANWWGNYAKYSVSFLKSMFGEAAKAPDFGYEWMPRLDDGVNYSWLQIFDEMHAGRIKGFFSWGQNPACSGANSTKTRAALAQLDWLVNVNILPSETGWFFQDPNIGKPPSEIATEVFVLPASASMEKEGSITNSGRWAQWRYKGADSPGDAIPDAEIINLIFQELRALYLAEGGAFPDPIVNLKWDYFHQKDGEWQVDPHAVARQINGYFLADVDFPAKGKKFKKGELVPSFAWLRDDGTTSSGNWLYCGSYTQAGNMAARRKREPEGGIGLNPEWGWCWPVNRRIIYNRASVDLQGRPWDSEHPVIRFEGDVKDGKYVTSKWSGDVPDGGWYPMQNPDGTLRADSKYPFIMKPEGHARLFGAGRADGPFPEHYEPLESPVTHHPFSKTMLNPACKVFSGDANKHSDPGDAAYPYVCSTYRVTEHWQTGVMTRYTPWLLELQPQLFVEMSHELAKEQGIAPGDLCKVENLRGSLVALALPTHRLKPLTVQGKTVHQVGIPWCFGWLQPAGGRGGDSANLLTPNIGDANTMIPETKAFMVRVVKLTDAEKAKSPMG